MENALNPLVILLTITLLAGCGESMHRHGNRPLAEWEHILENPERDAWQRPSQVIAALQLKPDEVVADIGAGTGYFTRRFVPVVKSVYAVDIDTALLTAIMHGEPKNVVPVLASIEDPRLPQATIDTVFICDVLHHIADRPRYYAKLREGLRANGRIVIVDFHKREQPVGPPPSMKLSDREVIDEMVLADFRLTKRYEDLPYQYMLEFRR